MANIDKVSVKNTVYNIVSPAVVSDYIEVIGGACTKPDGYVEDEVILAKQNDVQLLFKATQDIAFGANIVENTNCVRTTLEEVLKNAGGGGGASSADQVSYDNSDSGLEAENVQEAVDELATNAGTASSQIQTLTNNVSDINTALGNEVATRAKVSGHNIGKITSSSQTGLTGLDFTVNSDGSIKVNGTSTAAWSFLMNGAMLLKAGSYILSSSIGANPNLYVQVTNADQSESLASTMNSAEETFTLNADTIVVYRLFYLSGQTFNNVVVKPMIRLATDASSDYEPYAMTNREMTPYVQAISNPNLLDNPWFTVNQRGASSYGDKTGTTDSHLYTVDRWIIRKGQLDIQADGSVRAYSNLNTGMGNHLQLNQSVNNKDSLIGKTVTLSVKIKSLNVPDASHVSLFFAGSTVNFGVSTHVLYKTTTKEAGIHTFTFTVPSDFTEDFMNVGLHLGYDDASAISNEHYIDIEAIKLELGSVSTLAQDTAPNYATELLKCQRYFVRTSGNTDGGFTQYGQSLNGYGLTASSARVMLPKSMRTRPSISYSALSDFKLIYNGKSVIPTSINLLSWVEDFVNVGVDITDTDLQYYPCCLRFDNTNAYIDFSADL